jgi:hypothetical protein
VGESPEVPDEEIGVKAPRSLLGIVVIDASPRPEQFVEMRGDQTRRAVREFRLATGIEVRSPVGEYRSHAIFFHGFPPAAGDVRIQDLSVNVAPGAQQGVP